MNNFRFALIVAGLTWLAATATKDPSVARAADQKDRVAALENRVQTLERDLRNLQRNPELTSLKNRITDLERLQRQASQKRPSVGTSSGLSRSTRETTTFRTAIRTLEAKVSSAEQSDNQMRRDISSLRLKVSNLQSAVDRLR